MGQVDFLGGQVAFKAYLLPKGQGFRKSPSNKIIDYNQQEVALGKQNARAAGPKDKLEFTVFLALLKYHSLKLRSWVPVQEGTVILNLIRVPVHKMNSQKGNLLQLNCCQRPECLVSKASVSWSMLGRCPRSRTPHYTCNDPKIEGLKMRDYRCIPSSLITQ